MTFHDVNELLHSVLILLFLVRFYLLDRRMNVLEKRLEEKKEEVL